MNDKLIESANKIIHDKTVDYTLNNGNLGKILLNEIMYEEKIISYNNYKTTRFNLFLKVKESLNNDQHMPGIFNGISGIGLFLNEYNVLNKLEYEINQIVNKKCAQHIEKLYKSTQFSLFEFHNGLIGCGKALLGNFDYNHTLKLLIEKLIKEVNSFIFNISNDKLSPFFADNGMALDVESVTYNLGISHGLAGLLSFFIDFYDSNIENNYFLSINGEVEKCIKNLLLVFNHSKIFINDMWVWSDEISLVQSHKDKELSTFTWCRGMLGISASVYKGSLLINDFENSKKVKDNILKVLKYVRDDVLNKEICLCHGLSGIIYGLGKVFNYNDQSLNKYFLNSFLNFNNENYSFLDGNLGNLILLFKIKNVNTLNLDPFFGY